jgi:polysaccharide export outer membrane protein
VLLAAAASLWGAAPADARADRASLAGERALLAVERGPGGEVYTLVCPGLAEHRLLSDEDGLLVTVELPGVRSAVAPESLPEPAGPVRALSLGGGTDTTRVVFALSEPVAALASAVDRGLEVWLQPRGSSTGAAPHRGRALGAEDLLEISVFDVAELNRTVRISESGTLSLPLIGDVEAAGLTPRQLEDRLHDRLAERYVKDPQVSVFVKEHGSKKVSVIGAVGRPGVYEMLGPRVLLQVLAQAGGLNEEAAAELYVIRTRPDGGSERLAVNVDDLITSRNPDSNLEILPDDVITVPLDRLQFIYVDGAVKSPGRIEQPSRRPITLLQAISKAGGASSRANLKKVKILRKGPEGQQIILSASVVRIRKGKDPDPVLRDGDMVVVPEAFF